MRGFMWLFAAAGLLAIQACIPSLHPFYTEADLIDDPRLEGTWGEKAGDDDLWIFAKADEKSGRYRLTMTEDEGATFTVHLFRLDGETYLDFFPAEVEIKANTFYKGHLVPAHTLWRARVTSRTFQLAAMNPDRVQEFLKEKPGAIAMTELEDYDLPVFTSPTPDLQRFVLDNRDHIFEPFEKSEALIRVDANGAKLNARQAAELAARLANEKAEEIFKKRPFDPGNWPARIEDGRWVWGGLDLRGVGGYSAEVVFDLDGADPDAVVFLTTDHDRAGPE